MRMKFLELQLITDMPLPDISALENVHKGNYIISQNYKLTRKNTGGIVGILTAYRFG